MSSRTVDTRRHFPLKWRCKPRETNDPQSAVTGSICGNDDACVLCASHCGTPRVLLGPYRKPGPTQAKHTALPHRLVPNQKRRDACEKGWTAAGRPLFFHRRRRKAAGTAVAVPAAFYREKSPKPAANLTTWLKNVTIYMMNGRLSQEV